MKYFVLVIFSLFWAVFPAYSAESESVDTGHVKAQLISGHDVVAPGQSFYIALRTQIDPHWHTYWKNPGDSGEPVDISWNVPEGVSYGDIIWPLPNVQPTGPIINYGFEGTPIFPVEFKVSEAAQPGDVLNIDADIYYLVCETLCVPEDAQLNISLMVGEPVTHGRWSDVIGQALYYAPKPSDIKAGAVKDGGDVVYSFTNLPEGDFKNAHFFPFEQGVLDHSAPQAITLTSKGLQMRTLHGFDWEKGQPKDVSGVLRFEKDGKATGVMVTAKAGATVDIGALAGVKPVKSLTFWPALLAAFLGGLILNLMPCVFPVISMKALSVAKMAHEDRKKVRIEGWIYTAGVVATFLALTLVLLMLKAGGDSIGWGFQFQSPKLVAGLAILLFLIGLNLLGVFEFGSALQNTGSKLTTKGGFWGTFFTGALAVIVATPCTAPFMAGAVGFALAQPALVTVTVFMALAIGFALPFLLLAYMPGLLTKLPKPGPWMARFRELLSFPMFAAAIWLLWILTQQAGEKGLVFTLTAMLSLGFGIWLLKGGSISKALAVLALLAGLALPFTLHPKAAALTNPDVEAWSAEKVRTLRAEGQAVFVDFTAAWCVTCKVNEKLVLNKKDVQEIFTRTNTAFLVADWTNKNDVIADELARHGRSGVPLYLYYPPGNTDAAPLILPQILSKSVIETTLTH